MADEFFRMGKAVNRGAFRKLENEFVPGDVALAQFPYDKIKEALVTDRLSRNIDGKAADAFERVRMAADPVKYHSQYPAVELAPTYEPFHRSDKLAHIDGFH